MSAFTRGMACGAALLISCTDGLAESAVKAQTPATTRGQSADANARELADFRTRVNAYAAIRRRLDASLPQLSNESTPQEIDRYQRLLLAGVAAARATAKAGDIFTPPAQTIIKAAIARAFARGDRQSLRASIQDEDVGPVKVTVNGRYPDGVPLANMPAELLKDLPDLPPVVEYRFVGDTLILLDPAAHIIVDVIPQAMPR